MAYGLAPSRWVDRPSERLVRAINIEPHSRFDYENENDDNEDWRV